MPFAAGHLLAGRYQIIKMLGQGGFGAVYLAEDNRLARRVAVKHSFDKSREAQAQFQLEAHLLAQLQHPNLVRVSDYFIEAGSGEQFLVMDYIEGQDLGDMLRQSHAPVGEQQALRWLCQVCDAVAYLHLRPQPIIHRDIKPSNIKINPAGSAMLVDFGIAKIYQPQKGTALIAKAASGGFSPPEQYGGGTNTYSDVYALGATLYCLLTSSVPADAMDRLVRGAPLEPPSRRNRSVSAAVEEVILRAMQLNSQQRYRTASELLQALQGCMGAASTAQGIVCPTCGTKNRATARFCARDGTPLAPVLPAAAPRPLPSPPVADAGLPPNLHFELGNAYARNQDFDRAAQSYALAMQGGLNASALYHNWGLSNILAKRYTQAAQVLEQGARRYPDDPDIQFQLGRAYLMQDQQPPALQAFQRAVALSPQDADNRIWLAMVYQSTRQWNQAIGELEKATVLNKDSGIAHRMLGKTYIANGQYDRAVAPLKRATQLEPKEGDGFTMLGLAHLRQKKTNDAVKLFKQAIQLDPRQPLAHYFFAEALLEQKKYSEAVKEFQSAAALDPKDPDPHISIAGAYVLQGKRAEALAAARQALMIDPANQRARELIDTL